MLNLFRNAKKMGKAADRLKKAIAESAALGFRLDEDMDNDPLEADLSFEIDDRRSIYLHLKHYDYEDDTEVGYFTYTLYYGEGSQEWKHMTKQAHLYTLADTFYLIQHDMRNDAYFELD